MKRMMLCVVMMMAMTVCAKADWGYSTNVTVNSNGLNFTLLGLDAPADLTLFNINFTNMQAWAGYVFSTQTLHSAQILSNDVDISYLFTTQGQHTASVALKVDTTNWQSSNSVLQAQISASGVPLATFNASGIVWQAGIDLAQNTANTNTANIAVIQTGKQDVASAAYQVFETNSTAEAYYTAGNVGIGTNAPNQLLHVSGTIESVPSIQVGASDKASGLYLQTGLNVGDAGAVGTRIVMQDGGTGGKDWRIGNGMRTAGALSFFNQTDTKETITLKSGEIVLNEDSNDIDFRAESDGNQNMLFVDGGQNRVGIGTGAPSSTLDVNGDLEIGNNGKVYFSDGTNPVNTNNWFAPLMDSSGRWTNFQFRVYVSGTYSNITFDL